MMQSYKTYMERQKPSKELTLKTKEKMQQEMNRATSSEGRGFKWKYAFSLAAVLIILLGGTLYFLNRTSINQFTYSSMEYSALRDNMGLLKQEKIDVDEVSEIIGVDVNQLFQGFQVMTVVSVSGENTSNSEVQQYRVSYQGNDGTLVLICSKILPPAPDALLKTESQRVMNIPVYLGTSEQRDRFYAAWEKDGVFYYLTGGKMSQEEFTKLLEESLKK